MNQHDTCSIDLAYLGAEAFDSSILYEDHPITRELKDELLAAIPYCDEIVKETVKQWQPKTRARLREQMRLQMHFENRVERVPVEIKDGIPRSLFDVLVKYRGKSVNLSLRMQRENIRQTTTLLDWFLKNQQLIPEDINVAPTQEIQVSRAWLQELEERVREGSGQIIEILVSPDILGAYWYRQKKITIHWLAIGLMAVELNLSVQSVVPIVLFHEYVHAYHHLGFDSDGNQFSFESYANSETDFKEGIAQVYTYQLIRSYKDSGLQMKQAWDLMQSFSSPTYKLRKEWFGKQHDKYGREKEVIRMAVMKTRSQQSCSGVSLMDFNEALEAARRELL